MRSFPKTKTAATLEKGAAGGNRGVRLAAAVLFVAALGVVVWGSLTPNPPSAAGLSDKVQHFGAYLALGGLAGLALPGRPRLAFSLLVGLGVTVEFGQMLMGLGRHGSGLDALANVAGAGLGVWIGQALGSRFR